MMLCPLNSQLTGIITFTIIVWDSVPVNNIRTPLVTFVVLPSNRTQMYRIILSYFPT